MILENVTFRHVVMEPIRTSWDTAGHTTLQRHTGNKLIYALNSKKKKLLKDLN